MDASKVAKTLLVRSIEESGAVTIPGEVLFDAIVAAGEIDDDGEWLARRADYLLGKLSPSYQTLLAMTTALIPSWPLLLGLPMLVGLLSNYLGPSQKIHVVYNPTTALILWNLAVYLALILHAVLGHRGSLPSSVPGLGETTATSTEPSSNHRTLPRGLGLRRWIVRRAVPNLWIRLHKAMIDTGESTQDLTKVARAFWSSWMTVAQPLLAPALRRALHLGAVGLAVGAIFGMFVRGLFLDYQVVWRSTFITDPATVASVLRVLLGLTTFVSGQPVPDVDTARAMMTSEGVAAGPWIAGYALSTALVILVPRALLAAWQSVRMRWYRTELAMGVGSDYYQKAIRKAREARVGEIEQMIRTDVRVASSQFAEGVATFVETRLYDERIVPRLRQFREEGGKIDALEEAIAAECQKFEPELERHLEDARDDFERFLTAKVADSVGAGVSLRFHSAGSLSGELGRSSVGSTASVGEAIGVGLNRAVGYSVTATLGLVLGALSGGFGHSVGTAIIVGLVGTTGPIGFVIGALAGIAIGGAAYFMGRDRAERMIKRVALPRMVMRAALSENRLERMIKNGREKCHTSVEGLIKETLNGLLPEIADQIWRKVKPALGERQSVRVSDR